MTDGTTPTQVEGNFNPDEDRYPKLVAVLSRILDESELLERQVERVEVTLFASGDATYRIWEPRSEEPDGGHWPSVD